VACRWDHRSPPALGERGNGRFTFQVSEDGQDVLHRHSSRRRHRPKVAPSSNTLEMPALRLRTPLVDARSHPGRRHPAIGVDRKSGIGRLVPTDRQSQRRVSGASGHRRLGYIDCGGRDPGLGCGLDAKPRLISSRTAAVLVGIRRSKRNSSMADNSSEERTTCTRNVRADSFFLIGYKLPRARARCNLPQIKSTSVLRSGNNFVPIAFIHAAKRKDCRRAQ
jgi:hypothetical protein